MMDEAEETAAGARDISWRHPRRNAEWLLTVGGPSNAARHRLGIFGYD